MAYKYTHIQICSSMHNLLFLPYQIPSKGQHKKKNLRSSVSERTDDSENKTT